MTFFSSVTDCEAVNGFRRKSWGDDHFVRFGTGGVLSFP